MPKATLSTRTVEDARRLGWVLRYRLGTNFHWQQKSTPILLSMGRGLSERRVIRRRPPDRRPLLTAKAPVQELTIRLRPFGLADSSFWDGCLISLDDGPAGLFEADDIDAVLYQGEQGNDWDGTCAAVVRLKNGRYAAYQTTWGPTGSGFAGDAYGGDADIYFDSDLRRLILSALTDAGRRMCGIPEAGIP